MQCEHKDVCFYSGEASYEWIEGELFAMKDVFIHVLCAKCQVLIETRFGPRAKEWARKKLKMIKLEDWRYEVEMGGGKDAWRLSGIVFGHPSHPNGSRVFVSTPKEIDQNDEGSYAVKTASGRYYELGQCGGILDEQLKNIREDIERGGTLYL